MSASSETCAQRTGRSRLVGAGHDLGRPRRTASSARTAASVGDGATPTVCHRTGVMSDDLPGVRAAARCPTVGHRPAPMTTGPGVAGHREISISSSGRLRTTESLGLAPGACQDDRCCREGDRSRDWTAPASGVVPCRGSIRRRHRGRDPCPHRPVRRVGPRRPRPRRVRLGRRRGGRVPRVRRSPTGPVRPPARAARRSYGSRRSSTSRAGELAEVESRQAGKPIRLSTEFDVPGTVDNTAFFAGAARNLEGKAAGEYSGRPHLDDPPRGHRRRRLDRPVELPAADGRLEDPPGHRGRQHHRPQAGRDHAADVADVRPGVHRRRASRTGSSTCSPVAGRSPARRWWGTPTSRWCRSPGRRPSASRSCRPRRRPPSACTWSSAARRRSSCTTTPTSRRRSTAPSPASLINSGPGLHGRHAGLRAAPALRRLRRRGRRR